MLVRFTLADRVKETTTSTGAGPLALDGPAAGFQSFAVVGDGNQTFYCVEDGADWEVGIGTYTAAGAMLSRDTILASSNGGDAVNWGAGTRNVFIAAPTAHFSRLKTFGRLLAAAAGLNFP